MTIPAVPRRAGQTYPTSYAQTAMWLAERLRPGRTTMNMLIAVRLQGVLDRAAVTGAVADLVARHELLRTVFVEADGELRQLVQPSLPVPVAELDLRDLPTPQRTARAHQVTDDLLRQPFDLATGPLLRTALVRLDHHDHLLLMVMHHLISDGWSSNLIQGELRDGYARRCAAAGPELPSPSVHYVDYAVWQREQVASGALDAAAKQWRAQLAGPRPDAVLPCVPAPPGGPRRGARWGTMLPAALVSQLREVARPARPTPFQVVLSGYLALLARYTGCADLAVGVMVAGRSRPELGSMIGPFVNLLPVRLAVDEAATFRSLVTEVYLATIQVLADQELPYELFGLGEGGPPIRFASLTRQGPASGAGWAGLTEVPWHHDLDDAIWDLTLSVEPAPDGLQVGLQYLTDLLDEATVDRFGRHLRTLLAGMAEQPDRPVAALPLLSEEELRQARDSWNVAWRGPDSQPLPGPPAPLVLATIAEQTGRTPAAIALVAPDGRQLTYHEMWRSARRVAGWLRSQGVRPGDRVGMRMDRLPEAVIGMLGIMAAGAAFVPVSGDAPPARVEEQLADARVRLVLTTAELAEANDTADPPADLPEPGPDDLAYVIYTSGSTGRPNGVQVTHANLATTARAWREVLPDPPAPRRLLQTADLAFDVFVSDVVRALAGGGRTPGALVFCPREVLVDPPRLHEFMVRHAVTAAFLVPTVARLLAGHLRTTGGRLDFLDLLIFGVERMSIGEFHEFVALCGPDTTVLNSYGVTEATIDSTVHYGPVPAGPEDATMPIGRPLPGTRAYILDPHGQICPVGVTGELHLGGEAVARGYHQNPELTSARFGPDPFAAGGGRRYRTGDLARYHPDGTIELIGRVDHQLKVRGRRIDPGEVEAALLALPEVAQCVVVARELTAGDPQLVGYLVPAATAAPAAKLDPAAPAAEPDLAAVRAALAQRLPAYLVPGVLIVLPALPLTTNGKVDRSALPAPDPGQPAGPAYLAPRTPAEERLAQIWRELLGTDQVGVHDSFVARGGHSLLAARLVGEVRRAFGVELPLPAVFDCGTVATQAELIEELITQELADLTEEDAMRLLSATGRSDERETQP